VLNISRVDTIRRSLIRDLQYVVREELKRTLRHKANQQARYVNWAAPASQVRRAGKVAKAIIPKRFARNTLYRVANWYKELIFWGERG
jgi:hypothetical protein